MKIKSKKNSAFAVALGGVFLALCVLAMYVGSFIPLAEMTIFTATSIFVYYFALQTGFINSCIFYAAACLLGFLLVPDKMAIIPFVLVFGLYPIIKYLTDVELLGDIDGRKSRKAGKGGAAAIAGKGKLMLSFALKAVYYLVAFVLIKLFFEAVFLGDSKAVSLPVIILFILGAIVFVAYDIIIGGVTYFIARRTGGRAGRYTPVHFPIFDKILNKRKGKKEKTSEDSEAGDDKENKNGPDIKLS